ncbi:MAG: helix-turn-helix transcriptional regulator [Oscillospiraceae bacterium]|jgi:hypothetical protein|nr:helix-turn-helix transcriptional regulator [Oscillospiraceae bacterium]
MNATLLRMHMVANNDTQTELSRDMGIAQSALSMRINGKTEFRQNEINFIKKRYNLSDKETIDIFFADEVSEKDTKKGA